jgi:tetratricopeptide (TPR) repeat protein
LSAAQRRQEVRMTYLTWFGGALALVGMLAAGPAAAQATKPAAPGIKPVIAKPIAVLPVVAQPLALAAPRIACSPYSSLLARGEALNNAGKYDDAIAIADGILKKSPDDFQTNYFKGKTLYLKAAASDPNHWNPPLPFSETMAAGFDLLIKTAARLPQLDKACVANTNPYSILNTLGAFYINRGYFKEAQTYLLQAHEQLAQVPRDSKRKVCDNLGLAYLVQLQTEPAIRYYTESISYGSKVAPAQIKKAQGLRTNFFALKPAK